MAQELLKTIIRSRRRTLCLEVKPDASLIIRAPKRVSLEEIDRIIRGKLDWIVEKQRLARERYQPPVKNKFVDGEEFFYLGDQYKLLVVKDVDIPFVFDGRQFLFGERYHPQARSQFISWYKREALSVISERVKIYAQGAGLKYDRIGVRDARTRWGSCGAKGSLNFNWRLIMAPLAVIDYVVAHELAHLKERNHSARFWREVGILMPDYTPAKKWLKTNQRLLEF